MTDKLDPLQQAVADMLDADRQGYSPEWAMMRAIREIARRIGPEYKRTVTLPSGHTETHTFPRHIDLMEFDQELQQFARDCGGHWDGFQSYDVDMELTEAVVWLKAVQDATTPSETS